MKTIEGPHCQSCGSTQPEDIANLSDTEGYTRCCNERVVNSQVLRHNYATGRDFYEQGHCFDNRDCYHN